MSLSLSRSPYHCPRCVTPMVLGHAGGMDVHGCSTCGGVWLGTACAQKFAQGLPLKAIALAKQHAANATDNVDTGAAVACPICGVTMQRTHAAAAKLDLDFCGPHGTWYDRDELERIAQALNNTRWDRENLAPTASAATTMAVVATTERHNDNNDDDVVDKVIDGAEIAVGVLDAVDTVEVGSDVVGGVFEFFGSLFD